MLRSLTLAPKTKVNLRSLFHLIYEHARRWELTERNPIDLVRQRGGRRCIPRVLTPGEIRLLLAQLVEPYHTMVLVAACLGLRASEIVGLQWSANSMVVGILFNETAATDQPSTNGS